MLKIEMTPEQIATVRENAKEDGYDLSSNAGTIQKSGVTMQYLYTGTHIEITVDKPSNFLLRKFAEGQIAGSLEKWKDGE